MVIKIKLKNVNKHVLLDHEVFESLNNLPLFKEYKVFDNLREHSSGVPVFQKYVDMVNGKLKVESIYLALYIAKKFVPQQEADKKLFLSFVNGDKLDLRLKNLKWEPMSNLSRAAKPKVKPKPTGFRGVRAMTKGKFVATIDDGVKQVYLGLFETAEEAALAYNKKSIELFGVTENLNQLDADGKPVPSYFPEQNRKRGRPRIEKVEIMNSSQVEQVTLTPVHFDRPRKRGRKTRPENVTSQLRNTEETPMNGQSHDVGNSDEHQLVSTGHPSEVNLPTENS